MLKSLFGKEAGMNPEMLKMFNESNPDMFDGDDDIEHDGECEEVVQAGHPALSKVAEPIATEMFGTTELKTIVDSMTETLDMYGGIGLAAPQIGQSIRLIILGGDQDPAEIPKPPIPEEYSRDLTDEDMPQGFEFQVIANPVMTVLDDTPKVYFEGCLS